MQQMSLKKALLALTLCGAMVLAGCSAGTASWVGTLNTVITVAAPALTGILQVAALAQGKPVNAALVAKINTDAAAIRTIATDFANASSSAQPALCTQLQAAISTLEADLPEVLQVAQVTDANTQAKIEELSALIVGAFNSIEPLIPNCTAPPTLNVANVAPLSVDKFVHDYNAALVKSVGLPAVDKATPGLQLHK